MKTIQNLTPHTVNIVMPDGEILVLAPAGPAPRLAVTRETLPDLLTDRGSISISRPTMGAVEGLPDPVDGVVLVVSALVAGAVKRPDVLSPGELVRDSGGAVVGCRGLCAY